MRVVCVLMSLAVLAGCAETPEVETETPDGQGPGEPPLAGPAGRFVANLVNLTAPEVPFNVTLAYVDDNQTNTSAVSWTVQFANETAATTYNGTGLPATFEANLTLLGNVTLTGAAVFGEVELPLEPIALMVVAQDLMPVDPCLDMPVQDPISRSGLMLPGAANGGFVYSNNFDVGPCQTSMLIEVTSDLAAVDVIIRLYLPNGDTIEVDDNFDGGETLEFAPNGGLEPGAYDAQIRPYAVVAGNYYLTITFS